MNIASTKYVHYLRAGFGYDHVNRRISSPYDQFNYGCKNIDVYFSSQFKPSRTSEKVCFIKLLYRTPYHKDNRLLCNSKKVSTDLLKLRSLPLFWQFTKFKAAGEFYVPGIYTLTQMYGNREICSRSFLMNDQRSMSFSSTTGGNTQLLFNKDRTPEIHFNWTSHMNCQGSPKIVLRLRKEYTVGGIRRYNEGHVFAELNIEPVKNIFAKLNCKFYPRKLPYGFFDVEVLIPVPFQKNKVAIIDRGSFQLVNNASYKGDVFTHPLIVGKSVPFVTIPQNNIPFLPLQQSQHVQFPRNPDYRSQKLVEPSAPVFNENAKIKYAGPTSEQTIPKTSEKEGDNPNECCVCFEVIKQKVALIPCGHAKSCENCLLALKKRNQYNCPLCRTPIQSVLKIFMYLDSEPKLFLRHHFHVAGSCWSRKKSPD